MIRQFKSIHFVGIGGIGMSGIATVLHNLGYEVTGSDLSDSVSIQRLRDIGIKVFIGHRPENIIDPHVVVVSSAITQDNVEVAAARLKGAPVIPRAEMLAELGRLKYGVLIAGSHGKTTTTSLISTVVSDAGLDPTIVVGGKLIATNTNAVLGHGEYFVAEADESDGSFLALNPTIAVVTNIDREHMDYYHNMNELKAAFVSFCNKVPFYGLIVLCHDDPNVRELLPQLKRRYVTYGFDDTADFYANNIDIGFMKTSFDLYHKGSFMDRIVLPLSGRHNVCNSMACIAASLYLNIGLQQIKESLLRFRGIKRRLEFKGEVNGIKVFDDYGHHPTEIAMTIAAILNKRLKIVFQPHRYTRTRDLMEEFSNIFDGVGKVYLMDIYPAGEKSLEGISSQVLYKKMLDKGTNVTYVNNTDVLCKTLYEDCRPEDILITFGAGNVYEIGERFISEYPNNA